MFFSSVWICLSLADFLLPSSFLSSEKIIHLNAARATKNVYNKILLIVQVDHGNGQVNVKENPKPNGHRICYPAPIIGYNYLL